MESGVNVRFRRNARRMWINHNDGDACDRKSHRCRCYASEYGAELVLSGIGLNGVQ